MPVNSLYNSPVFLKSIFAVCLFIIFFIGGVTYKHITNLSDSTNLLVHTYKVNVELEQIMSYLKDAETGQRGFLITEDSLYLEPYLNSREKINNTFAQLKELTLERPVQQNNLKVLNRLIEERLGNFTATFKTSLTNEIETKAFKKSFLEGKNTMGAIRVKISEMIALENKLLNERRKDYKNDIYFTPIFLYGLLLLTLLFIIIAYNKITSDFKKLRATNDQLELFKEAANQSEIVSNHGNWVWSIEDNTFIFSDNFYRLLGEEPQSFVATINNFMEYVHPEDVEKLSKQVDKMMEDEALPYIYYRIIRKNGEIRHLKAFGKALYDSENNKRLLGTTTDITDEIDSFQKLEERNLELERNNKELSAFNYVASHDLQEPLRKIQTFVSRLEDKESEAMSESGILYMSRIKNASTRMRTLIDDLLQFSRTNTAEKVFAKTELNELLENAKQELAETIEDKNAIINASKLPTLKVIPFQIQQLFTNLIGNSLKYCRTDLAPKIDISYSKVKTHQEEHLKNKPKKSYHKIVFKDNGIGFEQDYADKIFILFSRLHNKDEYSGTGIGLSICKKIVENHKGYIYANGEPNVGAIFVVYLPA